MIRIMLQKLLHKKWMVISLLIGNILLIAIAVSHPMYKDASLQRMLSDKFSTYLEENNVNPAMFSILGRIRKSEVTATYERVKGIADNVYQDLGLVPTIQEKHHNLVASTSISTMDRDDAKTEKKLKIGSLTDLDQHATVLNGRMYADEVNADGYIEAVVTTSGFVEMNLIVGEVLNFKNLRDADGNPILVQVVGVIKNSEDTDDYWVENPDSFESELLISSKIFESRFIYGNKKYDINTMWYLFFDASKIRYTDAQALYDKSVTLTEENNTYGKVDEPAYISVLEEFLREQNRVEMTLMILQVPVLVLLCAFLFMISRQMISMEQSEISLFKSRGASRGQIMRLYLLQSAFLALIGLAIGLPLGNFVCRVLGSANAFLEFVRRRPLDIHYTEEVFWYALGAVLLSIIMTVLPAMKQSRVSIVKQKQSRARSTKPLWQKLFLDVILLGVSIYGYFNFRRQQQAMMEAVLTGKSLDPLLFLSSSLFILGFALVCLRIQPWIVHLIYAVRKKRWHPAAYASFLQIIRTGSRQYFIMTFLMLTIALGIFNTTVARTILANAEENLLYNIGTDLVIQEKWPSNEAMFRAGLADEIIYTEPDYGKYGQIPGVKATAQVYKNENALYRISAGRKSEVQKVEVLGVNTKAFGEATNLPDGLTAEHYYNYLNSMALKENGAILSQDFRDILEFKVGDKIVIESEGGLKLQVEICGFFDYFPGYQPTSTSIQADGSALTVDNYMVVAHLPYVQSSWGITPYEIWVDVDGSTEGFYNYIKENKIQLTKCIDVEDELVKIRRNTLFEGTNGILTMSFIVILILCGAGYLIYWILSIRSRELLFGIFRAMGMSRNEIMHMLINEQLFSSVLSIGCGAGIGLLASKMFVPMIQTAYSATDQVLPMKLITQNSDMVRLFGIIALVFAVCLIILARQIFKMKIAQALKLGED